MIPLEANYMTEQFPGESDEMSEISYISLHVSESEDNLGSV